MDKQLCSKCGINERIKWRTICRDCRNENNREWRHKNKGKIQQYRRVYAKHNKDAINKRRREKYRQPHVKEKITLRNAKYRQRNRQQLAEKSREYYYANRQKIIDNLFLRYWTDSDFRSKKLAANRRYAILNPREPSDIIFYPLIDEIDYAED